MNIKEHINFLGDGKYTIIMQQKIQFENYKIDKYNIDFLFELVVKNDKIVSDDIYIIFCFDKNNKIPILDKSEKNKLKEIVFNINCMEKDIKKLNFEETKYNQ